MSTQYFRSLITNNITSCTAPKDILPIINHIKLNDLKKILKKYIKKQGDDGIKQIYFASQSIDRIIPTDIIKKTFKYLDNYELIKLSKVSKSFCNYAKSIQQNTYTLPNHSAYKHIINHMNNNKRKNKSFSVIIPLQNKYNIINANDDQNNFNKHFLNCLVGNDRIIKKLVYAFNAKWNVFGCFDDPKFDEFENNANIHDYNGKIHVPLKSFNTKGDYNIQTMQGHFNISDWKWACDDEDEPLTYELDKDLIKPFVQFQIPYGGHIWVDVWVGIRILIDVSEQMKISYTRFKQCIAMNCYYSKLKHLTLYIDDDDNDDNGKSINENVIDFLQFMIDNKGAMENVEYIELVQQNWRVNRMKRIKEKQKTFINESKRIVQLLTILSTSVNNLKVIQLDPVVLKGGNNGIQYLEFWFEEVLKETYSIGTSNAHFIDLECVTSNYFSSSKDSGDEHIMTPCTIQ